MEISHITIGKILGKYDELKNNTIGIVVDAGAIPFYSKWNVYDFTLNDRYTVQNGFSAERFYQQNPVILILNTGSGGYPQDDLEFLENDIIKSLQEPEQGHMDEITLHPEFENYKLIASYPVIFIFAEKNFAAENPLLMQELIDNSTYLID